MRWEFSKIILAIIVFVYFMTVVFSYFVVVDVPEQLGNLLTFVATPTVTAVSFYAWKARAENLLKIPRKDREQVARLADKKESDENAMG